MKSIRKVHLYLGCFFAPMLIVFAISGAAQMFGLQLGLFTEIHLRHYGSLYTIILSVLMGLSVVVTALLGIVMALRMTGNQKAVRLCIVAGVVVPAVLFLLGGEIGKKKRPAPAPGSKQGQAVFTNSPEVR